MQCRDSQRSSQVRLPHVPKDCGVETRDPHGDYQIVATGSELSESVRLMTVSPTRSGEQGAEPEPGRSSCGGGLHPTPTQTRSHSVKQVEPPAAAPVAPLLRPAPISRLAHRAIR
ncbi:hypothetical protein EVAR_15039_1 [Eumeta japonica]|uniref:Uncharacterized protein n=1 Tax=Eumeta variegata TaxID=151549 RepID=A0A4C1X5K0_EUMVA|nr:hypothetical protein EVAR_15039_1 [Eumeta japonica]